MRRGFLTVDGRLVHYRRLGRGPALVLLHGSPNSSLSLIPLMQVLSERFDCIALDTPGNGLSDPLREDAPSTEDYAAAFGRAVDALGLKRFSLYGFHTGAGTAAAYAGSNPSRVASMALDGCAVWLDEEKRGMLSGYLPPFLPDSTGAHLAWLWSRVVEQTIFFPWHRPSAATRMDYDMPDPETLHRTAMELLYAGDHYRKPYAAALAGDGAARVRELTTPTLITAHPLDPIAHHLDRLEVRHPSVEIRREMPMEREALWRSFADFLARTPGDAAADFGDPGLAARRGFACGLFWRGAPGLGRPLVLLHAAGGSSSLFNAAIADAAGRPAIALDLPGHGESAASADHFDQHVDAIANALADLSIDAPTICGQGLGGAIALALKQRGIAVHAGVIGAPRASGVGEGPDLSPRWDGAHLLSAWHYARWSRLYTDWRRRDRAHLHLGEPMLDAKFVHERAFDLLKCGASLGAALATEAMAPVRAPPDSIFASPFDPGSAQSALARDGLAGPAAYLPQRLDDWGPDLAAF